MAAKTLRLFQVDDDPNEILLLSVATRHAGLPVQIQATAQPEKAIPLLESATEDRPDYILLDVNMPKITGLQLLRILKDKTNLKDMPVIMFTTSNAEQDITRARELGASGYVIKPDDIASTVEFVRSLHESWSRSEQPSYWPAAVVPV